MNSRIYTKEVFNKCVVDLEDSIFGKKKYILKKDYIYNKILYYKTGDIIECNGGSLVINSKYVDGKFLILVERPYVESFLKEYCYTIAEWRDIQIDNILKD
jgi:hypothetical protein